MAQRENDELVADFLRRDRLRKMAARRDRRIAAMKRQLAKAEAEAEALTRRLRGVNSIARVVQGIAICESLEPRKLSMTAGGPVGVRYTVVAPGLNRMCEAYTAASGTEGIAINSRDFSGTLSQRSEKFFGFGWRLKEAKEVTLRYVLTGQHPSEEEHARHRWLWLVDPEAKLSAARLQAVESAWRLGWRPEGYEGRDKARLP